MKFNLQTIDHAEPDIDITFLPMLVLGKFKS